MGGLKQSDCPICASKGPKFEGEDGFLWCPVCHGEFCWPMRDMGGRDYDALYEEDKEGYAMFTKVSPIYALQMSKTRPEFLEGLKIAKKFEIGRALDVGCGIGAFLKLLEREGIKAFGLDIAEKAIQYASKEMGLKTVLVGTIHALPFKGERFDLITAFHLLEHIDRPRHAVMSIKHLLRRGGLFFFTVPNKERLTVKIGKREKWDYPPHHLTRWAPETVRKFLNSLGFEIVKVWVVPPTPRLFAWGFAPQFMARRHWIVSQEKISPFFAGLPWKIAKIVVQGVLLILGPVISQFGHPIIALARKPL